MKIGWVGIALISGMFIPVQAAMNAKMRAFMINPFYSVMVNFIIGVIALTVAIMITQLLQSPGNWRAGINAPWWAWCGGLIGAFYVLASVLVVPRTGAAGFSVAIISGQLFGALIVDHYGLFGLTERLISLPRIAGMIFLLAGLWLVQRD